MNAPTITTARTRIAAIAAAAAVVAGGIGLATPAIANAAPVTKTITIDAKTAGADNVFAQSGVTVAAGSTVSVTATGTATFDPGYTPAGPNGFAGITCTDQAPSRCVLPGSPQMALVGKVGTAAPVLVGVGPTTLSGSGPLSFAFNDQTDGFANNEGSFTVTITYTPPCTGIFCFGS